MSQPQTTPAADVGSTFATADSPWMRYLAAIKDEWAEAQALYDFSQRYLFNIAMQYGDEAYEDFSATITDIDCDNNMAKWRAITGCDMPGNGLINETVNDFIQGFHTCAANVHTRLITLQWRNLDYGPSRFEKTRALFYLLFYHVLGIELELTLPEILYMLGPPYKFQVVGGMFSLPLNSRTIQLSLNNTAPASIACSLLGSRDIQGAQIHHVVICLTEPWIDSPRYRELLQDSHNSLWMLRPASDHIHSAVEALRMPPTAAEIRQTQVLPKPLSIEDPGACFTHLLENGAWGSTKTQPDEKRWHWLSSLIQLQLVQHRFIRMDMVELRSPWSHGPESNERFWMATDAIRECIEETSARLDNLCAEYDLESHHDVRSDLLSLKREVKATLAAADCVKADAQRVATQKTMEMSKLSISESRNAIALTVLALFFVPVSLASSIFGMNVQEINGTGPGIWQFAVTALVMLTLSAVSFTTWRMVRNVMLLYRHTRTHGKFEDFVEWRNRATMMHQELHQKTPIALEKLMYLFGLRRIEKIGIGIA